MQFITDLDEIQQLAERNECENKDFSDFLNDEYSKKVLEGTDEELLEFFQSVCQDIVVQINCTECANCCEQLDIMMTLEDIQALSESMNIVPTEKFIEKYVKQTTSINCPERFAFKQKPCPFLDNKRCTQYEKRPQICRRYPEDYTSFFSWLWVISANYACCPIAFNTYEQIKQHYWEEYLNSTVL